MSPKDWEFSPTDEPIDQVTNIDRSHFKTHQGKMFIASHVVENVEPAAANDFYIKTGASTPHIGLEIGASGNSLVEFFTDATASSNGTTLSTFNLNCLSGNVALTTFFHAPTLVTTGTQVLTRYIHGTSGGPAGNPVIGGGTTGGPSGRAVETILCANTNYLVRVTNQTAVTIAAADFSAGFYEG